MSLQDGPTIKISTITLKCIRIALTKWMIYHSHILNHFWGRCKKDYLLELRNSHQHAPNKHTSDPINIGDIVIIQETDQPRGFWRLAKIEDPITGSDGQFRGAHIWTRNVGNLFTYLQKKSNSYIHWTCIVAEIPTIMGYLTPLSQMNRALILLFPLRLMWGEDSHHPDQRELLLRMQGRLLGSWQRFLTVHELKRCIYHVTLLYYLTIHRLTSPGQWGRMLWIIYLSYVIIGHM